jgi:hypothetical protein
MELRRLRAGEWLAAVSGAWLLVSLFLPWYGLGDGAWTTGWEALAVNDVLLAIVALFGISLLIVTAMEAAPAIPIATAALTTIAGLVAVVIVLIRVASIPDAADSRELGLWLALLASSGIFVSGGIAMRDERISKPGRPTDASGAPSPPAPEIEPIPAPRP